MGEECFQVEDLEFKGFFFLFFRKIYKVFLQQTDNIFGEWFILGVHENNLHELLTDLDVLIAYEMDQNMLEIKQEQSPDY